ncbi:MAG: MATE family efflux transporter [Eubacteriales bacterium]|nr:MATE family efflux transporter [Eubacteriales bacterium]
MNLSNYFGDRRFYRSMLTIAIPIMIQNAITNFVALLDNIMVGQVGTIQMSSVSIVNQLIFVYNLCLFGGTSGAGIFTAQFVGKGDQRGIRYTVRFKLWITALISACAFLIFIFGGEPLISLYLKGQANAGSAAEALAYGKEYLSVMLVGLIPFALSNVYSSTLRENGETLLPMTAGIAAVAVNLCLNYILIFGHFGAPALGVTGAAIATVISRFTECFIVIIWTHRHKEKNLYVVGLYRSMRIPAHLVREITVKGTPLLLNEAFWSGGIAMLLQCYSIRGLSVVAAMNINSTLSNIFNIVFIAMGNTVAIILGQLLGAGRIREARQAATRMTVFSVLCSAGTGIIMALFHNIFPDFYNTSAEVRSLAGQFILVTALLMPLPAFTNASYFTLRSGGKTMITFFFDSVYMWVVNVPLAYCLSHFTDLPIVAVYFAVQAAEFVKCVIGFILVKKGIWLNTIVEE